ncbi:hypothetical protein GCM10009609_07650 [Pseudonocardia aurantiaca]|uniref:Uncharacterized protein n=1 Tax=Pseudonocardia aurantiaca TaxID=75290 RepID=A0ABW4FLC0_9PSEU
MTQEDYEVVHPAELSAGDSVWRPDPEAGVRWVTVTGRRWVRNPGLKFSVVRVEFADAPPAEYLPTSTFRRLKAG